MIRSIVLSLAAAAAISAAPLMLYDGSLGTTPAAQGWFMLAQSGGDGTHAETAEGGGTLMTTTGTERAVYSTFSPFALNRSLGYRLSFDLELDSESHDTNDRAGLSVVLIGSDLYGLEIAFWTDEVWVQNDVPIFTHGEGHAYDTTARTTYTVDVSGSRYTLTAGGVPLIGGLLRNYSAGGLPYMMRNSIFLGDDTYSASAASRFYRADATQLPEPAAWSCMAAALLALGFRHRFRRQRASTAHKPAMPTA